MLWCLRFMAEFSAHPLDHHARFLAMTGLLQADPGAQEHEMILRCVENAVWFDQVQAGGLGCLALLIRRAPMIKLRHHEKVIGGSMGVTVDDAHLLGHK